MRRAALVASGLALSAQAPEVVATRLANGVPLLVVERPGSGRVRAGLFFRGGSADTGALPPVAAPLLARALFQELRPEDLDPRPELDALLDRAENLAEELRILELRRVRGTGSGEEAHATALEATLREARTALAQAAQPADRPDLLDELGAVAREVVALPDALASTQDLPAAALPAWAALEARRLRSLRLVRLDRTRRDLELHPLPEDLGGMLLLENALPGQPYGRVLEPAQPALVPRGELRTLARRSLAPGRMGVVLVGDLKAAEAVRALNPSLGALDGPEAGDAEGAWTGPGRRSGPRRVQVQAPGPTQLRLGWSVPPLPHPDRLPLEVLALLLGRASGGQGLALPAFLGATAEVGVPGLRAENLFVVAVRPEEGRSLAECEQAVQRTLLRLQSELVSAEAFEGALRRLELAGLSAQADPAVLVRTLGLAWCQSGGWRGAFPDLRDLRREGPAAVARVARTWLRPDAMTLVAVEPDPARDPGDEAQAELLRLLRARALERMGDPVKAEALALQALQQLRLLGPAQRERLLEALKPAAPVQR